MFIKIQDLEESNIIEKEFCFNVIQNINLNETVIFKL